MRPTEVFLSHSNQDRDMAERLANTLARHGVPTFFSPQNILGAQLWQNEILGALQRCDWFIVLLAPDAINSMWVKREVALALRGFSSQARVPAVRELYVRICCGLV